MDAITTADYNELSDRAAQLVIERMKAQPTLVLGLATGSTPVGVYERLVRAHQAGEVSFASVTTFNLDEYCGLDEDHEQSYHAFMREHLFDHVDVRPEKVHFPACADESQTYDQAIADAGGIDLQILGIGRNGHIAFNEPGTPFDSRTHVVDLTPSTIKANARFFASPDDVPRQAVTMGLGTIMEAREILLLASGEAKRDAFMKATTGPVTEEVPASVLQRHPNVAVIADREAVA